MNLMMLGGVVLSSFIVGLILQRFVSSRLHRAAKKTAVEWDDALIESLRGLVVLWFLLGGLAVALRFFPLPSDFAPLVRRLLTLGTIFSVVLFMVRLVVRLLNIYLGRITGVPTSIFKNVAAIIIYLLGFMIILDELGISITPILTALGVGGLAFALALQDTLTNLFAGINILISKKVRLGDYVEIQGGEEGYVQDITWRTTTIRSLTNNLIIVPNGKLASTIVTNYHLPEKDLGILVKVGISYTSDLQKVEVLTREVAREVMRTVPGGVPEFEPFIRFNTFGDFGVEFTAILRGKEFQDQYLIKHEFIKRLQARYNQEGIEFPLPVKMMHFREKQG